MNSDVFLSLINKIRHNKECQNEEADYSYRHLKDGKQIRTYTASILLYPECNNHFEALKNIIEKNYNYAAILHNKDVKINDTSDDEEYSDFILLENDIPVDDNKLSLKKEHIHVVLNFEDARTNTAVAKELKISSRYVLMFSKLKSTLLYLIHRDYQDKYQYSANDVIGSMAYKVYSYAALYDRDDSEVLLELLNEIKYFPADEYIDPTDFSISILDKGYSPHVQQKYFYLINNCINYHNKKVEYYIGRNNNKKERNEKK